MGIKLPVNPINHAHRQEVAVNTACVYLVVTKKIAKKMTKGCRCRSPLSLQPGNRNLILNMCPAEISTDFCNFSLKF